MRVLTTSATLLGMLVAASAQPQAEAAARLVWQPVQEYFIRTQPGKEQVNIAGTRRLNSFTSYSHLGTDFGFHGPAEYDIAWQTDEICVHLGQEPDCWAGLWHSLSGLAREPGKTLNFAAAWPYFIVPAYQPRISSIRVDAKGQGRIKLEIKAENGRLLWNQSLDLRSSADRPYVMPVSPLAVPDAKLINWTVEPGSEVCVTRLDLGVETPAVPFDEYVLAASYAKLSRCYDPSSGFVRDRSHLESGAFESVASTGLYALATAAVSRPPFQIVSAEFARKTLHTIHAAVKSLERPKGLLPHFVRRSATGYVIHPGTEYSTVDTALFYHGMLMAALITGDEALSSELQADIGKINFAELRLPEGIISHGLKDDGRTLLPHGWNDWGGETALVMMLERLARPDAPPHKMERPGQAWQGTGFIPEIQSLFYPDFDSDEADALDGVKWLSARRRMFDAQRDYVQRTWKGSTAAGLGLYGLSAGEAEHGDRYHVGGVDLPDQAMIHPHYILMSAGLSQPADTYRLLRRMESAGYFPPWGLVETINVNGSNYLPMTGSLNAAFESLGAYHLLVKQRGITNEIYETARRATGLRRAVALFFPGQSPAPLQAPEPAAAISIVSELRPPMSASPAGEEEPADARGE